MQQSVVRVGKVVFEATTPDRVVSSVITQALEGRGGSLHFANAWSVVVADGDSAVRSALNQGRSLPDGRPVVWAMRILGGAIGRQAQRVDGPSLFERLLGEGRQHGLKHYLLGTTPQTLDQLVEALERRHPGVEIVGASSPPFTPLDDEYITNELRLVAQARPHVVWVGLGTPKQDLFAAMASQRSDVVFACVGAAFDMSAGKLRRAPRWMQATGLEWLYRFGQEPHRLWRRYTIGNLKFLVLVVHTLFRDMFSAPTR